MSVPVSSLRASPREFSLRISRCSLCAVRSAPHPRSSLVRADLHYPYFHAQRRFALLWRWFPVDPHGRSSPFSLVAIPVGRKKSHHGNHEPRSARRVVRRMGRRKRNPGALSQAQRLLCRNRAKRTQHRRWRWIGCRSYPAVRLARLES